MFNPEATITIADVLINLRQRLLDAIQKQDEVELNNIESALNAIEETLIDLQVTQSILLPVDHMISAIGDYFHGSSAKSTIPSEDEIRTVIGTYRKKPARNYSIRGKTEEWINARVDAKITRTAFVEALRNAVLSTPIEDKSSEELYRGLWHKTTSLLQIELDPLLAQTQSPHYRSFTSEAAVRQTENIIKKITESNLSNADTIVSSEIAMGIIQDVVKNYHLITQMLKR